MAAMLPMNQVGNVTAPEARLLMVFAYGIKRW